MSSHRLTENNGTNSTTAIMNATVTVNEGKKRTCE